MKTNQTATGESESDLRAGYMMDDTEKAMRENLADKFERLDNDGAFSGNPKYNAALSRLANTKLTDDELKAIYGSKWEDYK